jgi:hypothetical protein
MSEARRAGVLAWAISWGYAAVVAGQPGPVPAEEGPVPAEVDSAPAAEADGADASVPPPDASAPAASDGPPVRRLVVIDAATYGIDPVVGQHVTRRMRATAREMGYEVVDGGGTVEAARRIQMPYPPSPADLWRVTFASDAIRGAFAQVWAQGGSYVIEITVASTDGTGPFSARGSAGAEDLHGVVARLSREAIPEPSVWDATQAERLARPRAPAPGVPPVPPRTGADPSADFYDEAPPSAGRAPARDDRTPRYRFELALQTEAAVGTSSDRFYNHLAGIRLGYRINEDLILGAYMGYANLRGRGNRANNLLPYLQLEHRVRIGERDIVNIPLRFAVGYLPFNGPVIRVAGGLNFPIGDRYEVGLDLLTPTFWVLPHGTTVSLNFAAELVIRL